MPDIFDQIDINSETQFSGNDIFDKISIDDKKYSTDKERKIAKSFNIYGYQPDEETVSYLRNKAGIGLKGLASGLLGTPGDIANTIQTFAGIEEPKKIFPSSEEVGKYFEEKAGEQFTPEGSGEELLSEVSQAIGSIMGLGGPLKSTSIGKTIARTGLSALIPSAVSKGTEKIGAPPWAQASATIASALLTQRLTGKSLKDVGTDLFKKSESLIPEGTKVSTKNLGKVLGNLEKELKLGLEAPSEKAVLNSIKSLKNKFRNNQIPVKELVSSRRSLNEIIGLDEIKKAPPRARSLLNSIKKSIDNTLDIYGENNPEFIKTFREANSLFKGMNENKTIYNWIKSKPSLAHHGAAALGVYKLGLGNSIAIGSAAKAAEFASALARNPGLRKAYFNILKDAAKNELKGASSSLKSFNSLLKKEDKDLFDSLEKEGINS